MNVWNQVERLLEAKTEDLPGLRAHLEKIVKKMMSSLNPAEKDFLVRYLGNKGNNERFVGVIDDMMGVPSGYLENPPKNLTRK